MDQQQQQQAFIQFPKGTPTMVDGSSVGDFIEMTPHPLSTEFFKIIEGEPYFDTERCHLTPETTLDDIFYNLGAVLRQSQRKKHYLHEFHSLLTAFSKWLQLFGTKKLSDLSFGDYASHAIYSAKDGDSLVYFCQTVGSMSTEYSPAFIAPVPFSVLCPDSDSTILVPWLCMPSDIDQFRCGSTFMFQAKAPGPGAEGQRSLTKLTDVEDLSKIIDRPLDLQFPQAYHQPVRILKEFISLRMSQKTQRCLHFHRVPIVQISGSGKTHSIVELCQDGKYPVCMFPLGGGRSGKQTVVNTWIAEKLRAAAGRPAESDWKDLKHYLTYCFDQTIDQYKKGGLKNPARIPVNSLKALKDPEITFNFSSDTSVQESNSLVVALDEAFAWNDSDPRLLLVGFMQAVLEVTEEHMASSSQPVHVFLFLTATNSSVFDFISSPDTANLVKKYFVKDDSSKIMKSSLASVDSTLLSLHFLVLPVPYINVSDVTGIVSSNIRHIKQLGDIGTDSGFSQWFDEPVPLFGNLAPKHLIGGCPPLFIARFIKIFIEQCKTSLSESSHLITHIYSVLNRSLVLLVRTVGFRKINRHINFSEISQFFELDQAKQTLIFRSLLFAVTGHSLSGLRLRAHHDLVATGCGELAFVRGYKPISKLEKLYFIERSKTSILRVDRVLGNIYAISAIFFLIHLISTERLEDIRKLQTQVIHQLISAPAGIFGEGTVKGSVIELLLVPTLQNKVIEGFTEVQALKDAADRLFLSKEDDISTMLSTPLQCELHQAFSCFKHRQLDEPHRLCSTAGSLPPILECIPYNHRHTTFIGRQTPGADIKLGDITIQVKSTADENFFTPSHCRSLCEELTTHKIDLLILVVPSGKGELFFNSFKDSDVHSSISNAIIIESPEVAEPMPEPLNITSLEYGQRFHPLQFRPSDEVTASHSAPKIVSPSPDSKGPRRPDRARGQHSVSPSVPAPKDLSVWTGSKHGDAYTQEQIQFLSSLTGGPNLGKTLTAIKEVEGCTRSIAALTRKFHSVRK